MKKKNLKPSYHGRVPLHEWDYPALEMACDLLLRYDGFSFEDNKMSRQSAVSVLHKLQDRETDFTAGEIRVTWASIGFALSALGNPTQFCNLVPSDRITALQPHREILELLFPVYENAVLSLAQKQHTRPPQIPWV